MAKVPSTDSNLSSQSREADATSRAPSPRDMGPTVVTGAAPAVASPDRLAQAASAPSVMTDRERYAINSRQAEAERLKQPAEKFYMGERGGVTQAEVELMNRALEAQGGTIEAREKIERTWQRDMTDASLKAALDGTAAPVVHAGNMPGMPSFNANTMNVRPAMATKETDEAAAAAPGSGNTEAERGQKV